MISPAMIKPQIPENEDRRMTELRELDILDTAPEQAFDDLTRIASGICGMPISLVTFIDKDRQWFKSKQGLDSNQTTRDSAFCAHAINEPTQLFVVPDASLDQRFHDNPLVTGEPHIRFYAGAPLVTPAGDAIGTLCVIDSKPRHLEPFQAEALLGLSRQVAALLELRRTTKRLHHHLFERQWYEQQLRQYHEMLEQENTVLAEQSRTDPLTGLLNRRALNTDLANAVASVRSTNELLAVALLDLDHFKAINDMHGHAEGDRVLVAVAELLRRQCGTDAIVARYGGEEFAIVLLRESPESAQMKCESVRAAVQNLAAGVPVTTSIGVAVLDRRGGDDIASLYVRADRALYAAKHNGRNRVEVAPFL